MYLPSVWFETMKRSILLTIVLIACVGATTFEEWKKKQGKDYKNNPKGKSEKDAEKAYNANVANMTKHNNNPKATFKQEANSNADMTPEEMENQSKRKPSDTANEGGEGGKKVKGSGSAADKIADKIANQVSKYRNASMAVKRSWPDTLDYSSMMGPVRSSGKCIKTSGAFHISAVLEYWSKVNGSHKIFSPQNLLDCVAGTSCDADGSMYAGFKYAVTNGVAEESAYPYTGVKRTCQKKSTYFLQDCSFFLLKGDENLLKYLLIKFGPIGASMGIVPASFNLYKSGVYYDAKCPSGSVGSIYVLIVGYGTDPQFGDYWKIRTDYGPTFGENGYVRLARNKNNHCNLANFAEVPVPY